MGKYRLYFKEPTHIQKPPGEWKPWLPEIVIKHIKLTGVLTNAVGLAIIIYMMRTLNSDGELTAWILPIVSGIDSAIIRRICAVAVALLLTFVIIVVHEALHLLITIGKGDLYIYWNKQLFGVSPFSDCMLTWGQSVIYKILPFLVLSVGFYIVSLFISGAAGNFIKFVAVANFAMSSGDLLLTPFMFRLPRNAVFHGGGAWQIRD